MTHQDATVDARPSVFTQAARVGYSAANLIDRLRGQISGNQVANLRINDGIHGLEKAGAIEAVNNLLLQSDDGIIRVFPVWPGDRNASFVKLREKDAFHPWPGQTITVTKVGGGSVPFTIQNNVITFPTQQGATYTITAT